jgi:hypothetical protein
VLSHLGIAETSLREQGNAISDLSMLAGPVKTKKGREELLLPPPRDCRATF